MQKNIYFTNIIIIISSTLQFIVKKKYIYSIILPDIKLLPRYRHQYTYYYFYYYD